MISSASSPGSNESFSNALLLKNYPPPTGNFLYEVNSTETSVQAYAKLDGPEISYFVQSLQHVVLGRKTKEDLMGQIDVDLCVGTRLTPEEKYEQDRVISREHARLDFNFNGGYFELTVLGRNGGFIDDRYVKKGMIIPLRNGSKVQFAKNLFTFLLPEPDEDEEDFEGEESYDADDLGSVGWDFDPFSNVITAEDILEEDLETKPIRNNGTAKASAASGPSGKDSLSNTKGSGKKAGKKKKSKLKLEQADASEVESHLSDKNNDLPTPVEAPSKKSKSKKKRFQPIGESEISLLPPERRKQHKLDLETLENIKACTSKTPKKDSLQNPPLQTATSNTNGANNTTSVQSNSGPSDVKPDYSYAFLITEALIKSTAHVLSLHDIYKSIKMSYPYFQRAPHGWQATVRHNLNSIKELFYQAEDCQSEKSPWYLKDSWKEYFDENGAYKRKKREIAPKENNNSNANSNSLSNGNSNTNGNNLNTAKNNTITPSSQQSGISSPNNVKEDSKKRKRETTPLKSVPAAAPITVTAEKKVSTSSVVASTPNASNSTPAKVIPPKYHSSSSPAKSIRHQTTIHLKVPPYLFDSKAERSDAVWLNPALFSKEDKATQRAFRTLKRVLRGNLAVGPQSSNKAFKLSAVANSLSLMLVEKLAQLEKNGQTLTSLTTILKQKPELPQTDVQKTALPILNGSQNGKSAKRDTKTNEQVMNEIAPKSEKQVMVEKEKSETNLSTIENTDRETKNL